MGKQQVFTMTVCFDIAAESADDAEQAIYLALDQQPLDWTLATSSNQESPDDVVPNNVFEKYECTAVERVQHAIASGRKRSRTS